MKNWRWGCRYIFGQDQSFDLAPFQHSIMDVLFKHAFPLLVMSRGASKSSLYAMYAILKCIFFQDLNTGSKIVIVGSSFRQSREVFKYVESIWMSSPIVRECSPAGPKNIIDRCELRIGNSTIIAVPLGTGEKIRGLRATTVLADEVASIPEQILNTVVRGFTAVSANPIERMKMYKKLKDAGVPKSRISRYLPKNQVILAGTASYKFNHFYRTYDKYLNIIENKIDGPASKIDSSLTYDKDVYIDYRDYAVVKMPATKLPEGFLDETQLANARMTMSRSEYAREYLAEFADDSEGFFPRSRIDACIPTDSEIALDNNRFTIELKGEDDIIYVMGIDPARTKDNLAICIAKLISNKIKIAYMYSMHQKTFPDAARMIWLLLRAFNISLIQIDKGGGGLAIKDILQEKNMLENEHDKLIWDIDDEDPSHEGPHILNMIDYQGNWLIQANYSLKADFEHRKILFPIEIGEEKYLELDHSGQKFEMKGDSYIEAATKAWEEIEMAKEETSNIVKTFTPKAEKEHFDLPMMNERKTVRRKDRYSALLLAVDAARKIMKGDINANKGKLVKPAQGRWA